MRRVTEVSPLRSRTTVRVALAACGVILVLGVASGSSAAIAFGPAVAVLALLLLGRFVGEEQIERLVLAARRHARRPSPGTAAGRTRGSRLARKATARGGLLLACSLAVRPPPEPVAA
jgi:hypothetical protein